MDLQEMSAIGNFLNTDLDLCNTFVELARTELDMHNREHYEALLQKARIALETVRRLAAMSPPLATDDAAQVAKRCDELESSIQSVGTTS